MTVAAQFAQPLRIIHYAMIDAGLLQDGDDPTSDQLAMYTNRLNDLINLWGTQGLKLWTYLDQSITLTASTNSYTLGPSGSIITTKPMRAIQGYYLDVNNIRRPLYPLSWDEWVRLSNTTQTGAISQYFVDKQAANLVVYFWLTPDTTAATGTAHLLIPRQITNFTGLTDTLNFPQEWFMGLRWGLADDICTGQPEAIMSRCQQRAQAYRAVLEDWDVEDAPTQFQPNMQLGGYRTGSFI
jgi:hypothetical protein